MSYEISYRRRVFVLPKAQAGHYDDVCILAEEAGSNNCYELNCRRRSRSWGCLAAGLQWECLAEVTRMAAACCGGSLVLYGRRGISPEQYIRAWRKALALSVPFTEAAQHGFQLQLFVRILDVDRAERRKYTFERLTEQTLVTPQRGQDLYSKHDYTEWRFNSSVPEQVKLWLDTRPGGRGFHSVEVHGPIR